MSPYEALFLSATGSAALGVQRHENSPSPRWSVADVHCHNFWKVSLSPLLSANNIPHPWLSEWLTSLFPVSTTRSPFCMNLRLKVAQFWSSANPMREPTVSVPPVAHPFRHPLRSPPPQS